MGSGDLGHPQPPDDERYLPDGGRAHGELGGRTRSCRRSRESSTACPDEQSIGGGGDCSHGHGAGGSRGKRCHPVYGNHQL
jgi:hypothetical protein